MKALKKILLDFFKVSKSTLKPEKMKSLKPYVLLFDEFYTDNYDITKAHNWMNNATKFIFLGTSEIGICVVRGLTLNLLLKINITGSFVHVFFAKNSVIPLYFPFKKAMFIGKWEVCLRTRGL